MSLIDDELMKVASLLGEDEAVKIVRSLVKLKEATDDAIANDTGVRLNIVRKVLYKLYDKTLVSCTRVRDEKTGWYIFYWKLQPDQLDAFVRSRKKRTAEKLRTRLEYENSHNFFVCNKCGNIRLPFEEAIESAFRCPKCNSQLTDSDNSKIVDELSKMIQKLESEIKE
ncbi:transcription factor [[Eubacterium] cellulosolvens]|nr:transcription factor [Candidatus Bathyarchaeota archaeon]